MAKTKQPNTKQVENAKNLNRREIKNSAWIEDYLDLFSFKMRPVNEAFIERLASELIAWIDDEAENKKVLKQIRISQFYRKKKIPGETFYQWVKKFPVLKMAHDDAMMGIADKRESGVAVRDLDANVLKMMSHYDADWRAMRAWEASLKAEADSNSKANVQFIAVPIGLPEFPSSPLVPERKKDESKSNS